MHQHLQGLAKNTSIYGATSFIMAGGNLLLLPVFTRFLDPTEYGIVATTTLVTILLVPVLWLNQPLALRRWYFDYRDNEKALRDYTGTILWAGLLWSVTLGSLLVLFGPYLAHVVGIPFLPFLPLAIYAGVLVGITALKLSLWRAKGEAVKYFYMRSIVYVIGTVLGVGFVVGLSAGAEGRVWGTFLAASVGGIVVLVLFRRELFKSRPRLRYLTPSLAFGLPMVPHSVFREMVVFSDRVFLNHFRTLAETGLYSVGYSVASVLHLFLSAINTAWSPFVLNLIARQGEEATSVITKLISYQMLVIVAFALVLSLFAKEVVVILVPPRFVDSYKVIPIIATGLIFNGLYYMTVVFAIYMKETRLILIGSLSSGTLNLLLNWLLIPPFGIMGAAWATLISYAALFCIQYYVSWRLFPVRYEWRVAMVVALAIPVLVAGYWIDQVSSWSLLTGLAGKMAMVGAYGVFGVTVYLNRSEVRSLIYWGKRTLGNI